MEVELPPRYEAIAPLGKGGGGEVWSVRDRSTGAVVALKTLAEGGDEEESIALVREAIALSGLEGFGVPRVLRFGRLPRSKRPYLVREIVEGESLAALLADPTRARLALGAVSKAAHQLTQLHRAQLLHGDVKPANIIVSPEGGATLVDLGLVAAFREKGTRPEGLTLLYAAPELLEGGALTVRAEVFALGATLRDVLEAAREQLETAEARALDEVVARATSHRPEARYPSVDELANALVVAAPRLFDDAAPDVKSAWPIVGLDEQARALARHVEGMPPSAGVVVTGPRSSGRTTLMRRLAWTLGLSGRTVAWIEAKEPGDPLRAIELETSGADPTSLTILVDDADALADDANAELGRLREAGARLIVVASGEARVPGATLEVFPMARLDQAAARELVLRSVPSLNEAVVTHVVERAQRWPGVLRRIVELLRRAPVVGPEDVDRLMASAASSGDASAAPAAHTLERLRGVLERGHFEEAADIVETLGDVCSLELNVLRARLASNQGEWRRSLAELEAVRGEAEAVFSGGGGDILAAEYFLELCRAHLRAGDNAACEAAAEETLRRFGDQVAGGGAPRRLVVVVTEARAIGGLGKSFLAKQEESELWLETAVALGRQLADPRTLSIALGSLAFVLQRTGKLEAAQSAYEEALAHAEAASDAGTVATTRLNLAGVAKARGDLASALVHLEAAVDMGHRSGRRATLRQALLNLANLDLYLGRLARARVSIEQLAQERADLPPHFEAQLLALEAELAAKSREFERAESLCRACVQAYERLSRPVDAAEAVIEGLFASFSRLGANPPHDAMSELRARVAEAERLLGTSTAHRAALELARARIAVLAQDTSAALAALERSMQAAGASGKRDWLARAYQVRAGLLFEEGQRLAARKDRESALGVLEEIASKLPRDLREVYWDDPGRRSLREVETSLHTPTPPNAQTVRQGAAGITQDRLARVLEINREIAGTYDLRRLLERVTDLAIAFLAAERGFVILKSAREGSAQGDLSIHASRDQAGEDPHARFSQSIADRVIRTGEPIVTSSARDDARMADYVSVHQLMLQSVACVPIRSRSSGTIGALYLETRLRSVASFSQDLPLIVALADQVAIAIETARLVSENERRAQALEEANVQLDAASKKLEELLDHRTSQLQATRRDLRSVRAALKSHFGYEGLVGTSEAMRKVYALVDRIKDTDVPVLIVGESGTGKEVVARAIHNASPRARKPFLGLNCGAIPEHLLESELFGHMRGAFTGADRDRRGLFKEATEGTLLLDEIGEMPHKMQAGLLRVLQEKVVRPVGGSREETVDTRVIAATHRDLGTMVERGQFREDLFYRLNVIQLRVPPLRERIDDIPILIDHFLGIFAARYHRERRSVSRGALKMLVAHRWPGNVRQLENALLNAWVLSDGPELEPEDFELTDPSAASLTRPAVIAAAHNASAQGPAAHGAAAAAAKSVATSLDAHRATERDRMLQALSACNWNRVRAAELIGMPRRTFYRRLREYGIQ